MMSASYPFLRAIDGVVSSLSMKPVNIPRPSANVRVFTSHTERYDWLSNLPGGYAEVLRDSNGALVLIATLVCRDNLFGSGQPKGDDGLLAVLTLEPVPLTLRVIVDNTYYAEIADNVLIYP